MFKIGSTDSSLGRGVISNGEEGGVGVDAGITSREGRQEVVSIRMVRKVITMRFIVVFFLLDSARAMKAQTYGTNEVSWAV